MMAIFTAWFLHDGGLNARSVVPNVLRSRDLKRVEVAVCLNEVWRNRGSSRQPALSGKPKSLASRDGVGSGWARCSGVNGGRRSEDERGRRRGKGKTKTKKGRRRRRKGKTTIQWQRQSRMRND